ncbi:oocyte zinc finger protein 6-like protein [Chrysochromulina tobinii]|uniref:Oocyte zinc finger protein 6-like protein n=1 Tax=Chrysochromulina tobinii TaxID=1460289 RepID=A0A0M0JQ45_9EUKA|nr:oocyte zinc finger protein 6-like protein [Chrysochromulina tobinii]|eukprot:KOO28709.1 oocyte zinc finger protein 6-like protein [Chrysochromulina sp. CCMP291]
MRFRDKGGLKVHMRKHTGEQPFPCTWVGCDKRFSMKWNLATHMRTHTGDRPFPCTWDGCDKRFSQQCSLIDHMRTHTGDRPFPCSWDGCGMCFSQQCHLATHMRTYDHSAEAVARRARLARWREQQQPLVCQAAAKGPLPLLRLLDGFVGQLTARGISSALERALRFARRGLDSTDEPPDGDAESSVPTVAAELEVSPSEDDESELDDGGPVFEEAAPELAETSSPEPMTSAGATEALGILGRLRPRLPLGKNLAAEVARLEVDLHRVITVEATLSAADAARGVDAATLDEVARAGAESLRACFEGRASTGSTVPAVATLAATPTSEAGPCFAQRPLVILKCMRHSAYSDGPSKDPRQRACAERSPGDRLRSLGSLMPYDPNSWTLTGADSMYAQYISWPSSEPLPPQFVDSPGSHVRIEVGTDIVAACAPFAVATRAHAGRLEMSPEAIERVVTLNMSACVAACCSLEMHPGKGAPDRAQILRVECYGNGVDDEDAAAGPKHVDHANRPLYLGMRLGHLYLQKYGHPGGSSWGLTIRGAGRGHVLVRAVAHGGGVVEPSMTHWALTVATAVRLTQPVAFHEPTCVGDVFTSQLVRLVL